MESKEELIATLENIFAELTAIHDFLKTKSASKLMLAKAKIERLCKIEIRLETVKNSVLKYNVSCSDPKHKIPVCKYDFCELIDASHAYYLELIEKVEIKREADVSGEKSNPKPRVKLPVIDIPKFDGSISDWPKFFALFKSLIHDSKFFSNVEKFQYLKTLLSGDAANLIDNLPLSDNNYSVAYDLLKDRYQNPRLLANHYMKKIFEFRGITRDIPGNIQQFLAAFETNVQALKALEIKDLADSILLFKALSCLDFKSRQLFETEVTGEEMPTFKMLMEFMKDRLKVNSLCLDMNTKQDKVSSFKSSKDKAHTFVAISAKNKNCILCERESHPLYHCKAFRGKSVRERFNIVKEHKLCINCLKAGHSMAECRLSHCSTCGKAHHSLLHFESNKEFKLDSQDENRKLQDHESKVQQEVCGTTLSPLTNQFKTVLLPTAQVFVLNSKNGQRSPIRLLFDRGSQSNFLTERKVKELKLPYFQRSCEQIVSGINESTSKVKGKTQFSFCSRHDPRIKFEIQAWIVSSIASPLPSLEIEEKNYKKFLKLQLADERFMESGPIDGIIGAGLFAQLMLGDSRKGKLGQPSATNTLLGYVISGQASGKKEELLSGFSFCSLLKEERCSLERFWELEEVPSLGSKLKEEDATCEEIYKRHVVRVEDGRYKVALPFKQSPNELGSSFNVAKTRYLSLEKKLLSNENWRTSYGEVIQEYLDKGHMVELPGPIRDNGYFLPHHAVHKPDSVSTKLRVVFDASATSDSGLSLNDIIHKGPTLYTDVFLILLEFRIFSIGLIGDIKQMYRQIWLTEEHRQFQKILWRFSTEDKLKAYELSTVTFGVSVSPYLALRTVQQLCIDEGKNFPGAVEAVKNNIYMDDLVISIEKQEIAITLYAEIVQLFKAGGFEMKKWVSNSEEVKNSIASEDQLDENNRLTLTKVLGLNWNKLEDKFVFRFKIVESPCSKRNILSNLAKIFDPLGLLSPLVLYLKLLTKKVWELKLDWDAQVPDSTKILWETFCKEIFEVREFEVNRHLGVTSTATVELLGFSDASESAYGAVIYCRVKDEQGISVHLVCAKSKVAPMKVVTLPRLELCGMVLLAKLIEIVHTNFEKKNLNCSLSCFSDSTIALHWVNSQPGRWQTFVGHRVAIIRDIIPSDKWYHIPGKENPADMVSRGLTPAQLKNCKLWWEGPQWGRLDRSHWPIKKIDLEESSSMPEARKTCQVLTAVDDVVPVKTGTDELLNLAEKCSSFKKLLRSVVYMLKFCGILEKGPKITPSDLEVAERRVIGSLQKVFFQKEYRSLKENKTCSVKVTKLHPFLKDNLIRVGGRLANSEVGFDHRHPILLPKNCRVTHLIVEHYHISNFHVGPSLLGAIIRQRYWIIDGRNVIRRQVHKCNHCFRLKPRSTQPLMAELPKCRFSEVKAFLNTGVDFAGPLSITMSRNRGVKNQRAYLCLFVCLSVKAVHLELVSSLTTEAFLLAFKRFLARRGPCKNLYSDRGTNFVGAKNKLNELYEFLRKSEGMLGQSLEDFKINWHFNPPVSPHFGGIWESHIKSVKTLLAKAIGDQILSYEELYSVLVQIEALLNSRPLCALESDVEQEVLTPAHFLTFSPLHALPDDTGFLDSNLNYSARFKLVSQIVAAFWRKWRNSYLSSLQVREKWIKDSIQNIKEGALVLLKDDCPPLRWPLGRVVKLHPGSDGRVRVVSIKVGGKELMRPIVKVSLLPTQ